MNRPANEFAQHEGTATAELWRGSGVWPLQERPCDLEPPWEAYDPTSVTVWDCIVNEWIGPWHAGGLFGGRAPVVHDPKQPLVLPMVPGSVDPTIVNDLVPITIEQFPDDEPTIRQAEQLLLSFGRLTWPVSFEVIGLGAQSAYDDLDDGREILAARRDGRRPDSWRDPTISMQFVAHRRDAAGIANQLLAHHPNSAVITHDDLDFATDLLPGFSLLAEEGYGSSCHLGHPYSQPLTCFQRLDPDPLGVAVAMMDQLGPDDWAIIQVLMQPATQAWSDNVRQAAQHPFKPGKMLFSDVTERVLADKFGSPLFAVAVRLAARRQQDYNSLCGWAQQFAAPPQAFDWHNDESYGDLSWSLMAHCTFRPGMLLNTTELAGLVHLPAPSVNSERLRQVSTRTRPAVEAPASPGSIVLGDNTHRGQRTTARIPGEMRDRHTYIAGQTGTGKSTLLLNMIMQDIEAGHGVGVIDPHGDLVADVLARIPPERAKDVIYFNPTDTDWPPGFNILAWRDHDERDRLVGETISTLQKFSANPWGSRFEHIFRNALATLLRFKNVTIADVPRLLNDAAFRKKALVKLTQPELLSFWNDEFPKLPRDATAPILNRLSPLLLNSRIRNVICQRKKTINFDSVMNGRQIFLANLCSGTLTEEGSSIFGTFLMSKLISATFRRAALPYEKRRPFHLYVDEFQNFVSSSFSFEKILSEARKYRLILTVANQYVAQLSSAVRAAIIGNVGTMLTFRLGTTDAQCLSDEFGHFTSKEILSLERGQAIVRIGGAHSAFNLDTYPPPTKTNDNLTDEIIGRCRQEFAQPRSVIEASAQVDTTTSKKPTAKGSTMTPKTPAKPTTDRPSKKTPIEISDDEWDTWSDFVS